jgi:tRNA(Ile)-lysidine synthase
MALLALLADSGLELDCIAAYIDHGLRPQETGAEKAAVEQLARTCRARYVFRTVAVREHAAEHGLSIEDAARTLRYQALEDIRSEYGAEFIVVAHTADDQVEEFLLRMIRGAGRKGLTGMRQCQGKVVRPLLGMRKNDLVDYLSGRGIPFCVDSSNLDRRFLRSRIRLDLLPILEQRYNPSIRRTILQTMDILRSEEELLEQLTGEALAFVQDRQDRCALPMTALKNRHPAIRRRMIEQVCWAMESRPTFRQIGLILGLLEKDAAEAEIHLSGGLRILKTSEALVFHYPLGKSAFRGSGSSNPVVDMEIAGPGRYPVTEVGGLLEIRKSDARAVAAKEQRALVVDADRITFPLTLRSIAPGQRFRPFGGTGSRKINRFLNDRGIPSSLRHSCLILSWQDHVVALPGLAIDDGFRVDESTRTVLIIDWQVEHDTRSSA